MINGEMMRRHAQRGDTMVEVLICIVIVASILTGAFIITSRSQAAVRDSQEHSEAAKLVEGQLEQIRSNAKAGGEVFSAKWASLSFCMVQAMPVESTNDNCKVDSTGKHVNATPLYNLSISRADDSTDDGATFAMKAAWDSITGHGGKLGASETMYYREYPSK